jgi:hypothetical protein
MTQHSHQRAAGQRNSEQVVEDDVGREGEHGRDERVPVGAPAAEREGGSPEEQRARDGETERLDEHGRGEEDPGEQQHRTPVGRFGQVDVLAGLRLAVAAAQDVHGEQGGDDEQPGADDDRHGLRPDGPALGDVDVHGERVGQDQHAERQQQDADAEFGVLAQP